MYSQASLYPQLFLLHPLMGKSEDSLLLSFSFIFSSESLRFEVLLLTPFLVVTHIGSGSLFGYREWERKTSSPSLFHSDVGSLHNPHQIVLNMLTFLI